MITHLTLVTNLYNAAVF